MSGGWRINGLLAALLALAAVVAGCGGGSGSGEAVARVGGAPITKSTLDHWMSVFGGGRASADVPGRAGVARAQTLQFLIAARWAIGEAQQRGIVIPAAEVRGQIERAEGTSFPGGTPELREFLKSTGQTLADVELQARAQLAAAKLRQLALADVVPVTEADVASYYALHRNRFVLPEERTARFSNRKTRAAAERLKREVQAGKSLTSPAQVKVGEIFTSARVPPGNAYEAAIDRSPPHAVAGPYHLKADYFLYEVVQVVPRRQQALAEVRGAIRSQLTAERRAQALAELERRLASSWTAQTNCAPRYVVQKCRQYAGPMTREEPLRIQ